MHCYMLSVLFNLLLVHMPAMAAMGDMLLTVVDIMDVLEVVDVVVAAVAGKTPIVVVYFDKKKKIPN